MTDFLSFFSREDVREFIREKLECKVEDLLLNPPKGFKEEIKQIAEQILSRQKIKKKLPPWYDDLGIVMPPPISAEQTSSLAACQYKAKLLSGGGKTFTDLTGGMGADCLYLSEGFEQVTYVEANAHLCELFKHNASHFNRQIRVAHTTAEEFIKSLRPAANQVYYLDPDRRTDKNNRAFKIEDCSPNLHEIISLLDSSPFRMLVKYSPLLDLSVLMEAFAQISAIHIISVRNDCKEVLIDFNSANEGVPTIHCVNLETEQPDFSFSFIEERSFVAEIGSAQQFIYEPNASVLKAGAFNSIAQRYGLNKLGKNTHLYTGDILLSVFPGRAFRVLEKVTKKSMSTYAPGGKINVLVRNHPLSPQQVKSKWKVKDGGDFFILGYRDHQNKPCLLIAERLSPEHNTEG